MLVVSLMYAVTAVHGKDCTLHLLTCFPFVDLFKYVKVVGISCSGKMCLTGP